MILIISGHLSLLLIGEVGTIISTNSSELKKPETPSPTSDVKVDEEFSVRLGLDRLGLVRLDKVRLARLTYFRLA